MEKRVSTCLVARHHDHYAGLALLVGTSNATALVELTTRDELTEKAIGRGLPRMVGLRTSGELLIWSRISRGSWGSAGSILWPALGFFKRMGCFSRSSACSLPVVSEGGRMIRRILSKESTQASRIDRLFCKV